MSPHKMSSHMSVLDMRRDIYFWKSPSDDIVLCRENLKMKFMFIMNWSYTEIDILFECADKESVIGSLIVPNVRAHTTHVASGLTLLCFVSGDSLQRQKTKMMDRRMIRRRRLPPRRSQRTGSWRLRSYQESAKQTVSWQIIQGFFVCSKMSLTLQDTRLTNKLQNF